LLEEVRDTLSTGRGGPEKGQISSREPLARLRVSLRQRPRVDSDQKKRNALERKVTAEN